MTISIQAWFPVVSLALTAACATSDADGDYKAQINMLPEAAADADAVLTALAPLRLSAPEAAGDNNVSPQLVRRFVRDIKQTQHVTLAHIPDVRSAIGTIPLPLCIDLCDSLLLCDNVRSAGHSLFRFAGIVLLSTQIRTLEEANTYLDQSRRWLEIAPASNAAAAATAVLLSVTDEIRKSDWTVAAATYLRSNQHPLLRPLLDDVLQVQSESTRSPQHAHTSDVAIDIEAAIFTEDTPPSARAAALELGRELHQHSLRRLATAYSWQAATLELKQVQLLPSPTRAYLRTAEELQQAQEQAAAHRRFVEEQQNRKQQFEEEYKKTSAAERAARKQVIGHGGSANKATLDRYERAVQANEQATQRLDDANESLRVAHAAGARLQDSVAKLQSSLDATPRNAIRLTLTLRGDTAFGAGPVGDGGVFNVDLETHSIQERPLMRSVESELQRLTWRAVASTLQREAICDVSALSKLQMQAPVSTQPVAGTNISLHGVNIQLRQLMAILQPRATAALRR